MNSRRSQDWRPAAFFLGCGFSISLLMSWYLEPTRSLWLVLDEKVFWAVNNSLAGGKAWQIFWTAANNRAVDVISALSMIGLIAHFTLRKGRDRTDAIGAIFAMLTGMVITAVQIGKAMAASRPSPTLLHPDALRLSELVSWIPTKDISGDSFPGDHSTALLIFAGVITFYLPRTYAVAAWLIVIVFSAPRVVGGAHWLTDDLVGSAAVAGFVLSSVLATPLHRIMTDRLERLIARLRARRRNRLRRRRA